MIRVVLLGAGNAAIHLARSIHNSDQLDLVQYYSRSLVNASYFDPNIYHTDSLADLAEAEVYILAIKDEAIEEVVPLLKSINGLVVHTSGSVSLDALTELTQSGVLYPIQTLSKDRYLPFKSIPFAIEYKNKKDGPLLHSLASALSDQVYELNSEKRKKLHLAAVFANNFSNHMFTLSKELCDAYGIDFNSLKPLIIETAEKLLSLSPEEAQTGPAKRNDQSVIKDQASQLEADKKQIYKLLTSSIIDKYD